MLVRPDRAFPGTFFFFRGSALQHIWPYLLVIFIASVLTTVFHDEWNLARFSLTTTPFSLIGLALSIFLGFRNNACYDRWWEARKLWGALINTTRTLGRQVHTLAEEGQGFDRWEAVKKVVVYVYALKAHLRKEDVLASLAGMLTLEEREQLAGRANIPVALLEDLGERFQAGWRAGQIDTMHLPVFEKSLTDLTNIQGGCERIKNTPVPLSYTILTHRIVAIYCLALPLGIMDVVGPMTPVVDLFIAYAFLGLDSVGTQLEDPFELDPNDLPLNALARIIEIDLLQGIGEGRPRRSRPWRAC